jgi:uncharacterized damage-inducible protein DinB
VLWAGLHRESIVTVSDLRSLFDYSYWANGKLFSVLAQLTPEEFTRDVAGSYGSIRNTLVHVLSAEWGWLDRCGGATRGAPLKPADYPTLESLTLAWQQVERNVRDFLAALTDRDLSRPVEFSLGGGPKQIMPLGQLMHHAANHGIHHRGQVALLLRSLGHAPRNIDLLLFYSRNDAAPAL